MKRLFTLLFALLAAFSFKSSAQIVTCNADFNFVHAGNGLVHFTPVMIGDSLTTSHSWNFGDGSAIATQALVSHAYGAPGIYSVKHIIRKVNPNGVLLCADTVVKPVTIQTVCNLQAGFFGSPITSSPLTKKYTQTTFPMDPNDSVRWTFGDGTSLSGLQGDSSVRNPIHTFAQPGVYQICLRVKKNQNVPGTAPCVSEKCFLDTIQSPVSCTLQANFTWVADSANAQKIWFTNTSSGMSNTDSIRWTFGDGTASNLVNPVHVYQQPGVYTVCLRVQKRNANGGLTNCISEKCYVVQVGANCNLQVYFSHMADSLNPRKIYFNNQSQPSNNSDSLFWKFGDGSVLVGVQSNPAVANPVHEYAIGGVYVVCLRVKQNTASGTPSGCVREYCKTIVINQPCNLQVNFNWRADSLNRQKIYFQNASAPVGALDSLFWKFGDGAVLSGLQANNSVANPVHIYAQPGSYMVCLRIKKANSLPGTAPCIREYCKVITVQPACNINPSFTWRLDSLNRKKVLFTNTTASATAGATAFWSFGDGTSASTWNAIHEYAQPGKYYVCLKVTFSNNCIKTTCDTVIVPAPAPPCNQLSKFSFMRAATNSQVYTFRPDYIANDIVYTWTFGDGTGSMQPISTHYFAPGTYTVCLTAWKGPNCASTTCKSITITPQFNCNVVQVSYTYQKDPFMPNKVYFYAVANYPILDQTWTFRKVSPDSGNMVTLHQNNPTYIFPDTGVYKVCLRAVTLGGCIKEYCNFVHIDKLSQQCTLQAYPNPATTQVSVNVQLSAPEMIHVYIYNAQNVQVREKHQAGNAGSNVVTVPIGDLPAGQYTMKVVTGNRVCYSRFQKI